MTGVEFPAPRANGTADRSRRVGARIVLPAGGPAVRARGSPLTGSGVPAAAPLIIRSRIGAVRLAAGVIRNRLPRYSSPVIATLMLKCYGDRVEAEGAIRSAELAEAGDGAGTAVWRRITDAIGQLENTADLGPLHSLGR